MPQNPTPIEREAELAAKAGDATRLREILSKGTAFDTFVYLNAVGNGDVKTFQVILDHGGDINYGLGYSGSPLIISLVHNHTALLELLFARGVDPNLHRAEVQGSGALHIAAYRGDLERIKLLLQYGAGVNEIPEKEILARIGYRKKGTPVHWAIAGASTGAIQLLLEQGPDLDIVDADGISVRDRLKEAKLPQQ
ncbi:hypothetical protein OIDMADRAFT_181998 [Oidiodendron maius Zn]|uniref:Uncharacterized protein n=1 Tax=Oidiodendron maius (strain Zn) TaxID=913774 RepID=A0A0C3H5A6_OIDMZ|nr:hypothetical protein OIDMADRAFT_181998 [Oidiodendron maius Zn]